MRTTSQGGDRTIKSIWASISDRFYRLVAKSKRSILAVPVCEEPLPFYFQTVFNFFSNSLISFHVLGRTAPPCANCSPRSHKYICFKFLIFLFFWCDTVLSRAHKRVPHKPRMREYRPCSCRRVFVIASRPNG